MADRAAACYIGRMAHARRSQIPGNAPPPVSPDPGADAGAQRHHAAGDLRRPDGDPAVDRRANGAGGRSDRVCRRARRYRRPCRPHDQGPVEVRRRARQSRRFRQFRRRARPDPVFLAVARTQAMAAGSPPWCSRSRAACGWRASTPPWTIRTSRPLPPTTSPACRRRRRDPGAAAGLSRLPRRAEAAGVADRGSLRC